MLESWSVVDFIFFHFSFFFGLWNIKLGSLFLTKRKKVGHIARGFWLHWLHLGWVVLPQDVPSYLCTKLPFRPLGSRHVRVMAFSVTGRHKQGIAFRQVERYVLLIVTSWTWNLMLRFVRSWMGENLFIFLTLSLYRSSFLSHVLKCNKWQVHLVKSAMDAFTTADTTF